jgi:hypothetical protein
MKTSGRRRSISGVAAAVAAVLVAAPPAQARLAAPPHLSAPPHVPVEVDDPLRLAGKDRPLSIVVGRDARPARGQQAAGQQAAARAGLDTDWSAAGIGAGTALGLALVAGGGVLVTRQLTTT